MEKLTLKMCRLLIECIGITLKWVEDIMEERDKSMKLPETQFEIDELLRKLDRNAENIDTQKKANPDKFDSHRRKVDK